MAKTAVEGSASSLPSPWRRNWVWFVSQMAAQFFFTIWLRLRVRGTQKLPRDQGALLLINHQSYLDPLVVGTALRRPVSYLARDSLFRAPVVGWILRRTYVIPVNREAASAGGLKEIIRRVNHGFLVGIFPEGTRSRNGSVQAMRPGFISVVRRTRCPVYPVGVAGSGEAMPRGCWFVRPCRIRVVFGDPFTSEEIGALSRHGEEDRFTDLVRERVAECQRVAEKGRQW